MSQVKQTQVNAVLAFIEAYDSAPRATKARSPIGEAAEAVDAVQVPSGYPSAMRLEAFRAELERVEQHFIVGKRQHLVMATTAYGVRALGLPESIVSDEVVRFLHATDNAELPERLEAIRRTLQKHRSGQPVAWKHFYNLADVPLPARIRPEPPPEVLAKVEQASHLLKQNVWQPLTGKTDCAVFAALLTYANDFGRGHESGFSVSISTRDLALKAGRSHPTVLKTLRRLVGQGLIRREGSRRPEDAGVSVVLIHKVTKLYQSSEAWGGG